MRPGAMYRSISKGVHLLADGGKPYSFDGVLWRPPSISPVTEEVFRFMLGYGSIQNRSGVALNCVGFGARLHPSGWKAGQWTQGTTTFTDDTADAQSAGATDFAMETLTANSGFIVASLWPINAIAIDVGTASTGTNPVRTIEYSKADGTWAALSNVLVPPVTGGHYAVGENLIAWGHPTDLGQMVAGHGTGVPVGYYGYRFRSTTAPGTVAAVANSMSVFQMILGIENLADNNLWEVNPASGEHLFDAACDSVVAILSSKAAIQSMVHVEVRVV